MSRFEVKTIIGNPERVIIARCQWADPVPVG